MTKENKKNWDGNGTPHTEAHKSHRSGWLRAAVLGADDGLVSTSSLMLGVAAASASRTAIFTAGFAGLVAGAMSMAAGEYVSVSSQKDAEEADLKIEAKALHEYADEELQELTNIYIDRGLDAKLAKQVAQQLHAHDALAAHARDELGFDDDRRARPTQAGLSSAASFAVGSIIPIIAAALFQGSASHWAIVVVTLIALALTGVIGAEIGGGNRMKAAARVFIGGGLAMLVTAVLGKLIGGAL
jgi:VIT1/CCC1 family predicted Fe2+/Mn2+ transporter